MKELLLSFLLSISFNSFSQNDFLPSDSASWTGTQVTYCGAPNCVMASWLQVYDDTLSSDSIVGLYSYEVLKYRHDTTFSSHYGLYRVDTLEAQIWWIPRDDTLEYMFFDFDETYSIGDTISIPYYLYVESFQISNMVIQDIDSLLIDGVYYKEWNLSGEGDITICERLLSSNCFPFLSKYFFETEYTLMCYQESQVGYLGTCPWNEYNFGEMETFSDQQFTIHPNPSNGQFTFHSKALGPLEFSLFDLSGKFVSTDRIKPNELISVDLKPGVYIYQLKSESSFSSGKLIIE